MGVPSAPYTGTFVGSSNTVDLNQGCSQANSVVSPTYSSSRGNLILAPFAHMQKTSATLLIIDDDEVVRASLAAYLEDSGFSVLQASNGLQGLQVFEQEQPDLVICDLRMPQMSGLELIRQVSLRSVQTPVIVISGAGVMSDVVEALRLGAADYLIKPLEDLAVLEHSVHRALDRARLQLENKRYRDKLESANRELEASLHLLQEDQNAGRQVQMNMLPVSPWSIDDSTSLTRSFRPCTCLAILSTTSGLTSVGSRFTWLTFPVTARPQRSSRCCSSS